MAPSTENRLRVVCFYREAVFHEVLPDDNTATPDHAGSCADGIIIMVQSGNFARNQRACVNKFIFAVEPVSLWSEVGPEVRVDHGGPRLEIAAIG